MSVTKPDLITAIHPSGVEVIFRPGVHTYSLGETELVSTTSLIYKNFPVFDAQSVAEQKAKKDGVTPESLLSLWEQGRLEAANLGTTVHLMAETILKARDLEAANNLATNDRERKYLTALKRALPHLLKNYEVVEMEKIVFSPKYQAAGTIDLILKSRKTGNLVIADWKTNKAIKYTSFKNERGYGLCSHLLNCNFIHYSLQLALYRELLLQENYFPNSQMSCAIVHFDQKDGAVSIKQITPKDLAREAKLILDQRLQR